MAMWTQSQKAHSDLNSAILHKTLVFYHFPFHFQVFLCLRLPSFFQVPYRESGILFFFFSDMALHFLQGFVSLIINRYSHTHAPVIPTCIRLLSLLWLCTCPSIFLQYLPDLPSGSHTVCSFRCRTRQIRGWFSCFYFISLPTSPASWNSYKLVYDHFLKPSYLL